VNPHPTITLHLQKRERERGRKKKENEFCQAAKQAYSPWQPPSFTGNYRN